MNNERTNAAAYLNAHSHGKMSGRCQAKIGGSNVAAGYVAEIKTPANKREGMANAVQMMINRLAAGDANEVAYMLVNLLDDINSKSNPCNIGRVERARKIDTYRGTVNVD